MWQQVLMEGKSMNGHDSRRIAAECLIARMGMIKTIDLPLASQKVVADKVELTRKQCERAEGILSTNVNKSLREHAFGSLGHKTIPVDRLSRMQIGRAHV